MVDRENITMAELLIAKELREASIKADLAIACRLRTFSTFPPGYDFTELLAHVEQLERWHFSKPLLLDWEFLRDLSEILFSRMFGSLKRAPETGDWIEWMQFGLASWSMLMLVLRQSTGRRCKGPSLVHLARVLKFVNV